MKEKFMRFMQGRYGTDRLNRCLLIVSVVLLVFSYLAGDIFYFLAIFVIGYMYFRMFSKNIQKRYAENQWYLVREMKVRGLFQKKKSEFAQSKNFHIYRCPSCKQKIRVPRGRGKIAIRCQKCGNEFIKKS